MPRSIRSVGSQGPDYPSGQTDVAGSEHGYVRFRLPPRAAHSAHSSHSSHSAHFAFIHFLHVCHVFIRSHAHHIIPAHVIFLHVLHATHFFHAFHAFHAHHASRSTRAFFLGGLLLRFRFWFRLRLGILGGQEKILKQLYDFHVAGMMLAQKSQGVQQARIAISLSSQKVPRFPFGNRVGASSIGL